MKFTCEKNDIKEIISLAQNIIAQRNYSNILSCILFETSENMIIISATNGEISLKTSFYANIIENGSFVVNAKTLNEILRETPNVEVEFFFNNKEVTITNSNGKDVNFSFNIVSLSINDFPQLPVMPDHSDITVSQKNLKNVLRKALPVIPSDESRYSIPGALMELNEKKLRFVTTSPTILSVLECDIVNDVSEKKRSIIPQRSLQELYKSLLSEGECSISFSDAHIFFKYDKIVLSSVLIQKDFPNYSIILNTTLNKRLYVNKSLFLDAIKRMSIMAEEKFHTVFLNIKKNSMEITSENQKIGSAKEFFDIEYENEDMKICFSSDHLVSVVNEITEDIIQFDFNKELTPVKITGKDEVKYIFIVMPMRNN